MEKRDNYQLLIEKLDQFSRKYYVNQGIRGVLYSTGLILALFLGLNFAENYFYFDPSVNAVDLGFCRCVGVCPRCVGFDARFALFSVGRSYQ